MTQDNKLLEKILDCLDELQAIDVKVLDVKNQTAVTDYMIVASGRSSRHVKAIAETTIEKMKHSNHKPLSSSGLNTAEWALVDFGDCILHVMQAPIRAHYNLESFWSEEIPN